MFLFFSFILSLTEEDETSIHATQGLFFSFFFQDLFSLFLSVAKHTKKKDYEKEEKNKTTICKVHSESKQKGHLDFYMAK